MLATGKVERARAGGLGTVKQAMTSPAITADKGDRLDAVLKRMAKHGITKMPVLDAGKLVGICTDGLIADKLGGVRAKGLLPGHLHAAKVMSRDFEPVALDTPLDALLPKVGLPGLTMLPVIERGELLGVHTKSDLLPLVTSEASVATVMRTGAGAVRTVAPNDRLIHARRLLLEHDIQRLPVLDDGQVVGIIAEWEIANAFARFLRETDAHHQKHGVRELAVEEWMVGHVVAVGPDHTAREAARRMVDRGVGGLPVLHDDGHLLGIVTRTDLIRTLPAAGTVPPAATNGNGMVPRKPLTRRIQGKGRGTVSRPR